MLKAPKDASSSTAFSDGCPQRDPPSACSENDVKNRSPSGTEIQPAFALGGARAPKAPPACAKGVCRSIGPTAHGSAS